MNLKEYSEYSSWHQTNLIPATWGKERGYIVTIVVGERPGDYQACFVRVDDEGLLKASSSWAPLDECVYGWNPKRTFIYTVTADDDMHDYIHSIIDDGAKDGSVSNVICKEDYNR